MTKTITRSLELIVLNNAGAVTPGTEGRGDIARSFTSSLARSATSSLARSVTSPLAGTVAGTQSALASLKSSTQPNYKPLVIGGAILLGLGYGLVKVLK